MTEGQETPFLERVKRRDDGGLVFQRRQQAIPEIRFDAEGQEVHDLRLYFYEKMFGGLYVCVVGQLLVAESGYALEL